MTRPAFRAAGVTKVYVVSAPVAGRLLRVERHAGDAVTVGDGVRVTARPTP